MGLVGLTIQGAYTIKNNEQNPFSNEWEIESQIGPCWDGEDQTSLSNMGRVVVLCKFKIYVSVWFPGGYDPSWAGN